MACLRKTFPHLKGKNALKGKKLGLPGLTRVPNWGKITSFSLSARAGQRERKCRGEHSSRGLKRGPSKKGWGRAMVSSGEYFRGERIYLRGGGERVHNILGGRRKPLRDETTYTHGSWVDGVSIIS